MSPNLTAQLLPILVPPVVTRTWYSLQFGIHKTFSGTIAIEDMPRILRLQGLLALIGCLFSKVDLLVLDNEVLLLLRYSMYFYFVHL